MMKRLGYQGGYKPLRAESAKFSPSGNRFVSRRLHLLRFESEEYSAAQNKKILFLFFIALGTGFLIISFALAKNKQFSFTDFPEGITHTFRLFSFSSFPSSSPRPTPLLQKTYPYTIQSPPEGTKVIENRFVASQNFPEEKTPSSEILLDVASACGYNKTKGLQCGGATSVFRDIKGECVEKTPIPYDPCCGAPPQIDPRDPEPSCPRPPCPSKCGCSPPPEGCTCLPLACNCVCAARAGGGEFAWLWDSVTGFCGCNP